MTQFDSLNYAPNHDASDVTKPQFDKGKYKRTHSEQNTRSTEMRFFADYLNAGVIYEYC